MLSRSVSFIASLNILIVLLFAIPAPSCGQSADTDTERQLLRLKIYHLDSEEQEQRIDHYLEEAYIPALKRQDLGPVGVFKPIGQDTLSDKRVYVLTGFDSFQQLVMLSEQLASDRRYRQAGAPFINAEHDNPPFNKIETILLRAFSYAPQIQTPDLDTPKSERVYELRSYGSATEALNKNKVEMFNEGGEVDLFAKLNFNAVFYGNVISGSDMPNLMYMTSFKNMEDRDKHWQQFGSSPEWQKMSSLDKYQNNVSRIDIQFLRSAGYSDI